MTKLLTLGILFSTAVNAEVVARLLMLGISALTSFFLVLRIVLVTKLVISNISSSILLILELFSVFLTTSFYTTLLSLLKSIGTGANLSISDFNLLYKLLKLVVNFLIYQYLIYLLQFLTS